MDESLPLPALLCHTFVAFTIECDNEFERQMPHRTTDYGLGNPELAATHGFAPWLVSLAMWFNCLKYVPEQGISVAALEQAARAHTNLDGMRRWGYITLTPSSAGTRPPLSKSKPKRDWLIHATPAGRKAREVCLPLCASIEQRWQQRFGNAEVARLRQSLSALVSQLDPNLPDTMTILGYGLFTRSTTRKPKSKAAVGKTASIVPAPELEFPVLLSRILFAFALEFEQQSEVSLAISANVLRFFEQKKLRVRDLPRLSGVSKEAIANSLSFLEKRKYAIIETEPASRTKIVALTAQGHHAKDLYADLVKKIEERWRERFDEQPIANLREALEQMIEPNATPSRLFEGMKPNPNGWRAKLPMPEVLPHFPMVLHRGGYPDGS